MNSLPLYVLFVIKQKSELNLVLTFIIFEERFKYLRFLNSLRDGLGKSAMKFSDKSNKTRFSAPWNTSLLNLVNRLWDSLRYFSFSKELNALPSMRDTRL